MYRFGRTKGAVSVFLVIILVPCLLVSSIFVDLGRIHLSKNVAEASADLALNTLMTYYDADLSEYYGMVASCQDIDSFYNVSAQYFLRMLKSQNLTEDELFLLSDSFASMLGDDSIYDLLEMECETGEDSIIKAVDGADLTNASIIKTQVVEFMKYRGPLLLVEGLIGKLKAPGSGAGELEDQSKNEELVENKKEYYEAEGELLQKAYYSYIAIRKYTDEGVTNEWLQQELDQLKSQREQYREIHALMVSNLFNTSGLSRFSRPIPNLSGISYDKEDVCSREVEEPVSTPEPDEEESAATPAPDEPTVTRYYIDGDTLSNQLNTVSDAIDDFREVVNQVITAGEAIPYESDTNDIQYWVRLQQNLNQAGGPLSKISSAGYAMVDACAKLSAMADCDEGEGLPAGWSDAISNYEDIVSELESKYLTSGVAAGSDKYLILMERFETISNANIDNINPDKVRLSNGKTISGALADIAARQADTKAKLKKYLDLLNTAINGDSGANIPSLDELRTLVGKYGTSLDTWSNTANTIGTTMAEEDKSIINGTAANPDDNLSPACKEIARMGEAAVGELKSRLENIRTQITTVYNALDSMQYGNAQLYNITGYSAMRNRASTVIQSGSIGLTNTALKNYAEETFQSLFVPYTTGEADLVSLNTDARYHAMLNPETGREAVPSLYTYMHDQFKNANYGAVEDVNNGLDDLKDMQKQKENEMESQEACPSAQSIKPSFSPGNTSFGLSKLLTGVTGLIGNLINGNFATIRDNLYVGAYMMEMFSYDTYETEGKYSLVEDKSSLKLTNYTAKYNSVMGAADKEGTWLSELPTDTYNKGLTNQMINLKTHAAYRCEIEYILYGKSSNTANVRKAYSNIYTIRFALNLVSCFQHFWGMGNLTGQAINAIAAALSAATLGIIPTAVIKVVMLTLLTVCETAIDQARLRAGFPVEIYKAAEDWVLSIHTSSGSSISGQFNSVKSQLGGGGNGDNKEKGIQYSDYLMLFVMLGLNDSKISAAMCQRMAEVIQANMGRVTSNKGYAMSNAKVYFQLEAQIKTEPLLITLPIFDGYNQGMGTSTGWRTYKVKMIRGYS